MLNTCKIIVPNNRYCRLLVAAFVLGQFGLAQPAVSQESQSGEAAQQNTAALQPWSVSCAARNNAAEFTCTMVQEIRVNNTGQRVISASITREPDGKYFMQLLLPHGIKFFNGVRVSVDGAEPYRYGIDWGDQNGSYARTEMDDEFITALKRGAKMSVSVVARSEQRINFEILLIGFTKAFEKL